jgi:phage gp36-like protein
MYLTEDDYSVVCDEVELDVLTQSEEAIRQKAERVAMEEVASYIRPRYDIAAAFAAQGDDRNSMLVQIVANIALYYLAHWLPGGMSLDRRQVLYEQSIEWLTKVGKGSAMPDLPTYTDEGGDTVGTGTTGPIRFGSQPRTETGY